MYLQERVDLPEGQCREIKEEADGPALLQGLVGVVVLTGVVLGALGCLYALLFFHCVRRSL
jgi:hypothetical protein